MDKRTIRHKSCLQSFRSHLLGSDRVYRSEFGDPCSSASDPAKYIDLGGVGQGMCEGVWDDLEKGVSSQVLEIVDVGLHHYTIDTPNKHLVVLMESKLDVGFAELDLFPTGGRARVRESGIIFYGKLTCSSGIFDLIDETAITPGKETI